MDIRFWGMRSPVLFLAQLLACISVLSVLAGCGPSRQDVEDIAQEGIATAIARIPTPTPQPTPTPVTFPPTATPVVVIFPTPLPTPTPAPMPTPQPTATPVSLPPFQTAVPSFRDVYARVKGSVVYLDVGLGFATGWVIERGLIVAAAHSVRGVSEVGIRAEGQPPVAGQVIGTDAARDVAFIKYAPQALPLVPLPLSSPTELEIGQPLLVLGYSLATVKADGSVPPPSAKQGILSVIEDKGAQGRLLRIDAVIDPGDSGGPVVNLRGQAVGLSRSSIVATSGGQRVVGAFFALHIDDVADARKKVLSP